MQNRVEGFQRFQLVDRLALRYNSSTYQEVLHIWPTKSTPQVLRSTRVSWRLQTWSLVADFLTNRKLWHATAGGHSRLLPF
jgi:hypothetical protein